MESLNPQRPVNLTVSIRWAVLVLLAIAAPSLAAQESFIEVSGNASQTVPVDRVQIALAVETVGSTAAEAGAINADLMDAVHRALRDADLPGLDIETFGYSMQPQYQDRRDNNIPAIIGYRAVNNVRITSTDVEAAGRILDLATEAGANRVISLGFAASDTQAAEDAVLAEATRDATRQAQIMADALGRELGRPLEVRGGADAPTPPGMFRAEMAMARAAPTPIEAGDQVVRASVTVRFRLGPPR